MSAYPSLPLFTDAFIADTGHLSAQETGAYLMLMMVAWRSPDCRLADDDDRLARWARVDRRTWLRIKPTIMEFWTLDAGFWSQKRLTKEREFVSKRAEVNRRNGEQGGRPKSLKNREPANPAGSPRVSELKAPNPNPSPKKEEQGSDAGASGSSDEPNVPLSPKDLLWRDGVLTLRGLGMADPAARRFIGKLLRDTGGDSGRVHWAIDEAKRAGTGDPIPLVTRILNDTPTNARAGPARFEGRDSAATVLLKRDAEARRNEQSPHEPDFFDDRTGRFESRGRSPRDEAPQRDRMGGAGQVLDLVAVGSHRR